MSRYGSYAVRAKSCACLAIGESTMRMPATVVGCGWACRIRWCTRFEGGGARRGLVRIAAPSHRLKSRRFIGVGQRDPGARLDAAGNPVGSDVQEKCATRVTEFPRGSPVVSQPSLGSAGLPGRVDHGSAGGLGRIDRCLTDRGGRVAHGLRRIRGAIGDRLLVLVAAGECESRDQRNREMRFMVRSESSGGRVMNQCADEEIAPTSRSISATPVGGRRCSRGSARMETGKRRAGRGGRGRRAAAAP